MRLVQTVSSGELSIEETPRPSPRPTDIVSVTAASLISPGTERSVRSLAESSLVAKAKARPDLVREVLRRARTQGVVSTLKAVRNRLAETMPLGYSAAGTVVEVGEAVDGIRPGDRVATAGAPHADLQIVSGRLVARLPDSVSFEEGAFVTVASIALNGLRLAELQPGAKVLVVGLGLVGQLAARIAVASGAKVCGIDPVDWKREKAQDSGAMSFPADENGWSEAVAATGGVGYDAVIVTAATKSSEPMVRAGGAVRDRGVVVLVGDAGLELDRRPLYEREVTLRVARSYGPGRYDPVYEELGIDYPIGGVRWTAQRNMEAVIGLMASKRLEVSDLITHRFPFESAVEAYSLLDDPSARYLGIVLEYQGTADPEKTLEIHTSHAKQAAPGLSGVGLIGAGRFARGVLLPAAVEAGFGGFTIVCSASGSSAVDVADKFGFRKATADADAVTSDPDTSVVFIASRHDSHAGYAVAALEAGKHVFCEKPLAITEDELDRVVDAYRASPGVLMVGFNRRWSPAIQDVQGLVGQSAPLQVVYRVNAGTLPDDHWLKDRRMGGRLIGEATHFIDTCNAIVGETPRSVLTLTSGRGELALDEDFTIALGYPGGSQATIVYASKSATQAGKERVEILGSGYSMVIDDYGTLAVFGPAKKSRRRYRPADKGHNRELEVFAELVRGNVDAEGIATSAFITSQVAFAAIRSAMTGEVVELQT